MFRWLVIAVFVSAAPVFVPQAMAQSTVECHSRHYQYDECFAGRLTRPQLVHQISSSACILNRSWGYNPKSRYIWVAQGCSGVFADVGGYHHGRGDTFDPGARVYDSRGHDTGSVVTGIVIDALVQGLADGGKHSHRHTTSNYHDNGGYNGCHGAGCMVDNPDEAIDNTPQFDKDGEPNFDTHGNYQGCHGDGCLVDNPDDE